MFIFLLFQLALSTLYGQVQTIKYDQITNFSGRPDTTTAMLTIDLNKNVSLYEFGKVEKEETISQHVQQDGSLSIRAGKRIDTIGSYVRTDLITGHLELREKAVGNYFLVSDTISVDWSDIMVDTVINGMDLKKTTCSFRGREYTVSFLPDDNLSAGPWKFRGLPGLIIEASDLNKEVTFKAQAINREPEIHELAEPQKIAEIPYFSNYEDFRKERNKLREQDVSSLKNRDGNGQNRRIVVSQVKVDYLEKD
ncbi:GLPGLI family protein [Parapedobacter luteus]|uniref:GLPGLI family protein n=2 Tax=Parapedobacter luteus TaxID=623280 RepID=A0A1T5FFJ6_9SPHI|nr:GLPGLI family protein [Parapedobacter luteus]